MSVTHLSSADQPDPPPPPRRKVLLVEDERGQARIVEASFGKFIGEKFGLDWAANYDDALNALKSARYDACLLDYHLGGGRSGLDLLREVTALGIDTPVIMVTSENSPEVDQQALEIGALDYLLKFEMSPRSLERALRYTLKQHQTLHQLRHLVTRDPTTGLFNRGEGLRLLDGEIGRARRFSRPFTVLLADVDSFKRLNEVHGRAVGDKALVIAAKSLTGAVGDIGTVVRWGGDEFLVILPHADAVAGKAIAEEALAAARALNCLLSIGMVEWQKNHVDTDLLVAAARAALAEARAAGGNRLA
ncbi:MAG: diguanylate cyclase [Verrucomicrobiota bacterium]